MTKKLIPIKEGTRVPRPFGTTLALIQYHQKQNKDNGKEPIQNTNTNTNTNIEEELLMIKKRVIDQWSSNGMVLNNKVMSMNDMVQYMNLPESVIYKYMWKAMGKLGKVFNFDKGNDIARAIFGMVAKKSFESSALLEEQAKILMRAQGGEYKPYISQTVNQALMSLNNAQAPMIQLLKMLTEKTTTNIFIGTPVVNPEESLALNTDGAIKLIHENSQSMLDEPRLALPHITSQTLPDINPRTQDVGLITQYKPPIPTNPIHPAAVHPMPNPKSNAITTIEAEEEFVI